MNVTRRAERPGTPKCLKLHLREATRIITRNYILILKLIIITIRFLLRNCRPYLGAITLVLANAHTKQPQQATVRVNQPNAIDISERCFRLPQHKTVICTKEFSTEI